MTMELQKNQVELAELERENAWKEMAKQVAHEIKNPLTPMKLAVQQLIISYKDKNKNFDNIFKKVSTTLLNQIESLSQIATEFSRFARMPNYNMEELDLLPVLHDVINLFMEEKVEINIESSVETAIIEADKVQLRRLFINLIRNSIQAQADSINVDISVKRTKLTVSVEDNGTGIPDQYKDKIFEANFTTKEKGMGIGLKIAKRFMESIKGDIILVESSEKGTNFEIIIPIITKKTDKTSK
jgi:nitrogen fixation/metabolism regulation signal transduction histidine kinase